MLFAFPLAAFGAEASPSTGAKIEKCQLCEEARSLLFGEITAPSFGKATQVHACVATCTRLDNHIPY